MVNEWEKNIHFKVLHSRVIDFSSSGSMKHSLCRSWYFDHYINRIRKCLNFPPEVTESIILSLFSGDFLASV
jgi:hypothetical protein